MQIIGFVWLHDIVEKLAVKHHVRPEEVEEVFFNQPRFRFAERGHRFDENVYECLGLTLAGRYLAVFFIHKSSDEALILSAREMTTRERRRYGRK